MNEQELRETALRLAISMPTPYTALANYDQTKARSAGAIVADAEVLLKFLRASEPTAQTVDKSNDMRDWVSFEVKPGETCHLAGLPFEFVNRTLLRGHISNYRFFLSQSSHCLSNPAQAESLPTAVTSNRSF